MRSNAEHVLISRSVLFLVFRSIYLLRKLLMMISETFRNVHDTSLIYAVVALLTQHFWRCLCNHSNRQTRVSHQSNGLQSRRLNSQGISAERLVMVDTIPSGLLEACVIVGVSDEHLRELCQVWEVILNLLKAIDRVINTNLWCLSFRAKTESSPRWRLRCCRFTLLHLLRERVQVTVWRVLTLRPSAEPRNDARSRRRERDPSPSIATLPANQQSLPQRTWAYLKTSTSWLCSSSVSQVTPVCNACLGRSVSRGPRNKCALCHWPDGLRITNESRDDSYHFLVFTDVFGNQTHGVVAQYCKPVQVRYLAFICMSWAGADGIKTLVVFWKA